MKEAQRSTKENRGVSREYRANTEEDVEKQNIFNTFAYTVHIILIHLFQIAFKYSYD